MGNLGRRGLPDRPMNSLRGYLDKHPPVALLVRDHASEKLRAKSDNFHNSSISHM